DPRVATSEFQKRVQPDLEKPVSGRKSSQPTGSPRPLRVAINAVSLAPGGGLVVLLGYLHGWRELGMPLDVQVYASRLAVREELAAGFPDVQVIPFAADMSPSRHFVLQQSTLG